MLTIIILKRLTHTVLLYPFYDNVNHKPTLIKASINHGFFFAQPLNSLKSLLRGEGEGYSELNSDLSDERKLFFDPPSADKPLPVPVDRGRPRYVSPPPTRKKWRTGAVKTFSAELVEL